MAEWEGGVLWLPKAINYNPPESKNVVKSWAKYWDLIPEVDLKAKAYEGLKGFLEGFGQGFLEGFLEGCSPPDSVGVGAPSANQDQDQEQEQDQEKTSTQEDLGVPDPGQVMVLWNEICGAAGLPRVQKMTADRRAKVRTRSKRLDTLIKWRAYFEAIVKTPFLMGESKDGWMADFDYAVRNEKHVNKVREGSYLTSGRARPAPSNALDAAYQEVVDEEALTSEDMAELSNITETDNGRQDREKVDDIPVRALPVPGDQDDPGSI